MGWRTERAERAAFTVAGASGRLSPAPGQSGPRVRPRRSSGCTWVLWASPAQSLLQEDSPAEARSAVCGLWRVGKGPRVPRTISPWSQQQL